MGSRRRGTRTDNNEERDDWIKERRREHGVSNPLRWRKNREPAPCVSGNTWSHGVTAS